MVGEAPRLYDSGLSVSPYSAQEKHAQRRRWAVGVLAVAAVSPLVWLVGTRPLVSAGAGPPAGTAPDGRGRAAKGVAPLVDHEAPGFALRDAQGQPVELKQFRGRPVLLNFWATWCAPCKEEMPEFEEVYRQHKDQGLVVLAVSLDDEAAAKQVPGYLREGSPRVGSYTFPVALDTKQEVARSYRLAGIPASYFLDQAGVIRVLHPGAMTRQQLLDRLRAILPVRD